MKYVFISMIYLENKHEYSYVAQKISNFIERLKNMLSKRQNKCLIRF